MPYVRKGKCVHKQNADGSAGAQVGCSDTVEEAKAHLKALYANVPDASKEAGSTPSPYAAHGPGGVLSAPGQTGPKAKKKKKVTNAMITPKEFQDKYKVSEKDFDYAQQETWVVESASQAFSYLMSVARSEMYQQEQDDTQEIISLLKSLASFISDQLDEMSTAVDTPTNPLNSLFAYKEASRDSTLLTTKEGDHYRWVLWTGSAFEDRDGEIISEKAFEQDCDTMELTGDYGELLWWHCDGEIHPERGEKEARPYIPLGRCDLSLVSNKINIESGIYYDDEVGAILEAKSKDFGASKQFYHKAGEPLDGVFSYIRTKERSIMPRTREANLLTRLFSGSKEKEMADNKERIAALKKVVGDEKAAEILEQAQKASETAEAFLKSKEAAKTKKADDKEDAADKGDDEAAEGEAKKGKEAKVEVSLANSKELLDTLKSMKENNEAVTKEIKGVLAGMKEATEKQAVELEALKSQLAQTQTHVSALLGIQPRSNRFDASEKGKVADLTEEQKKVTKEAETGTKDFSVEDWIISGSRLAA